MVPIAAITSTSLKYFGQIVKEGETTCKLIKYSEETANFVRKYGLEHEAVMTRMLQTTTAEESHQIVTAITRLEEGKQAKFLNQLNEDLAGIDIEKLLKNNLNKIDDNLVDAWNMLDNNGCKFIKTNTDYLEKFSSLKPEIQQYLVQFTDESMVKSTLKNFLDDMDEVEGFKEFVENPENEEFVKGFIGHKNLAFNEDNYRLLFNELDELEQTTVVDKVRSWLTRSEELKGFLQLMEDGRQYGRNMVNELVNSDRVLLTQVLQQAGKDISEIDKYAIFKEVQLWVNKEEKQFMQADAVLVKYGAEDQIKEVLVLESKINIATDFTPRQKQGWQLLSQGGNLEVKAINTSINSEKTLLSGGKLSIEHENVIKVNDHGKVDGSFEISTIDVNKYQAYGN
jgi:hypothetical protein